MIALEAGRGRGSRGWPVWVKMPVVWSMGWEVIWIGGRGMRGIGPLQRAAEVRSSYRGFAFGPCPSPVREKHGLPGQKDST